MSCQQQEEILVKTVCEIYDKISKLESLKPSEDVNKLLAQLKLTCIPPNPIDTTKLCQKHQEIRTHLIQLRGESQSSLETHFSTKLGSYENPLDHIEEFPAYPNYIKLGLLEFTILGNHTKNDGQDPKSRIAFVGSGPLPLSSILLASNHLRNTSFQSYDFDESANYLATRLVSVDPDLSKRMFFHTTDILNVSDELSDYEVVFLGALVGINKNDKVKVINHLAKYMAPNSILMLRSAHGARGFIYPIVDLTDLKGFEVLQVFHPTNEVMCSIIIARKSIINGM
ncbi:nicotianamine synthase-like [Papaver somniferum]|uniref:nicotianamine synthase-like n=1 Tax=Papaver somniferum TaxID=3469 RepID=UPI000E6FFBE5|nr:nicotianamine synthase-like [Papaver somniferum]